MFAFLLILIGCKERLILEPSPWDPDEENVIVHVDSFVHDANVNAVWLYYSINWEYVPDSVDLIRTLGYKNGIKINQVSTSIGYIVDANAQSGETNEYSIAFAIAGSITSRIFGPFVYTVQ